MYTLMILFCKPEFTTVNYMLIVFITNPDAKKAGYLELQETSTGLKIRFDKKTPGAKGYKGKNHYHIYNPNATSNKNLYLDKNGNPVSKNSSESHILPGGNNK